MNKQFMMVAALLGTLAVSSCVDDKETQAVIDARNTAAEQIEAAIALNNSGAQILKINADAEVALKAAQVAVEAAQAAQIAAETATIEKQNEIAELKKQLQETYLEEDKASLELKIASTNTQLALLAGQKENAELSLQNAKAKFEKAQINIKTQYAEAQAELIKRKNTLATNLQEDLTKEGCKAQQTYESALSDLQTASKDLTDKKAELAKLQLGMEDAERYQANAIRDEERKIVDLEAQITALKKVIYYLDNEEMAELKALYQELLARQTRIGEEYNYIYMKVLDHLGDEYTDKLRDQSEILSSYREASEFYQLHYNGYIKDANENRYYLSDYGVTEYIYDSYFGKDVLHVFGRYAVTPLTNITFTMEDEESGVSHEFSDVTDFYFEAFDASLPQSDKEYVRTKLNEKIKDVEEHLEYLKKTIKASTDNMAEMHKASLEAEKAYNEAEKAYSEGKINYTSYNTKKQTYLEAVSTEADQKQNIESMGMSYDSYQMRVEVYQKYIAYYCDDEAKNEFLAKREACHQALVAIAEKILAQEVKVAKLTDELAEVSAQIAAIAPSLDEEGSYGTPVGIAKRIRNNEDEIVAAKKQIETYKKVCDLNPVEAQKYCIEEAQNKVASAEANLQAATLAYEAAKAVFDEFFAE